MVTHWTKQQLEEYIKRRQKAENPDEFIRQQKAKLDKMAEKEEKKLQSQCEALLRLRGIEYLHLSFRAREKVGWPDLVFALPQGDDVPGLPVAVELKSQHGSLRPRQKEVLRRLRHDGWQVHVIRSLEAFKSVLDQENPDEEGVAKK